MSCTVASELIGITLWILPLGPAAQYYSNTLAVIDVLLVATTLRLVVEGLTYIHK